MNSNHPLKLKCCYGRLALPYYGKNKMNTTKKTFDIYGEIYTCYMVENGYDQLISVFDDNGELLFKFEEPVSNSGLQFLLKGYAMATKNGVCK